MTATAPCQHPEPTADGGCPWCTMALEKDRRYLCAWWGKDCPDGGAGTPQVVTPALPPDPRPCRHLGGPTGTSVECPSCAGKVSLKLLHCGVHGACTAARKAPGVACCVGCPDREAAPPAEVRRGGRPRVLFCSHDLSRTGAPTVLANLLPRLRGFDVRLHSPADGPLAARFTAAGIPVTHGLPDLAGVDLVVANALPSAPAVLAASRAGVPSVWLVHESDPALCGNLPDVEKAIGLPRRVVFPSHATRAAWEGLRPDGLVIPTTVPPVPPRDRAACRAALGLAPGELAVLTAGADEPRKGQADLRAACRGLAGVRPFYPCGEPDPWSYYAAADVYACCSRSEAFPLATQEAKAYGLPVVTTPVFGCAEQVHDRVHGLHYPPGDVAALRAHLTALRDDPALRTRLSRPFDHLPPFDATLPLYEDVFRQALGLPARESDLVAPHVVYHVAGIGGHWRDIVREQLSQLASCGLTRVLATHVGSGLEWLIDEATRRGIDLTVCQHEPDPANCEVPAMRLVERLARKGDDRPVLYLHSKGVSRPLAERWWHEWRRLVMRELVVKWREHLPLLATLDAVGVNWWFDPANTHFSGNFWMARPSWLRRLPRFDRFHRDRYSCEVWIGSVPGCQVRSLVCHDRKFWSDDRDYLLSLAPPPG